MNLSEPFIRRPIATSLLMAGVIMMGLLGYLLLPISALPPVDFPTIQVTAQYPGAAPWGCQMPTKRFVAPGAAAVWRRGVCAGSIDSRNGKAKVVPTPRRNVRRGICFLVMNIYQAS